MPRTPTPGVSVHPQEVSEEAQSQVKVLEWKTGLLSTWFFLILGLLSFTACADLVKTLGPPSCSSPPDQEVAVRRFPGGLAESLLGDVRAESSPEHGKAGVLLQALGCSRCIFYGDVAKCHVVEAMAELGFT